ncbi:hypothetical protein HYN69_00565 [Gemmobacter aquarius]|uniref:Peptidase M16 C-terminal domain-containing protein n=1 Tax=Paragemmobacter aquarius TaxID=2169400 RepID=A0A2S0UHA6_9RHOB|nr:insulinase family protein [Gemmobacter aquarius]AWB47194.1 hypothetical protein HYN69_00565 [Gemmobacter aquarius]
MRTFAAAALALTVLAACRTEEKAGATIETSPGGMAYARLYIPAAEDVAIQIAWPSNWAMRDDVNQAVPYIGTDLILAGGAAGFPAGEVVETFADLNAEGTMWVTVDHLHGQLIAPKENMEKAVGIAAAHLAQPTMVQAWFGRLQQGLATHMAEVSMQPAKRGYDALRWAVLGDTPLRRALSVDPPAMIAEATRAEAVEWHRQTVVRSGARIVVAGEIGADEAGTYVDALFAGLGQGDAVASPAPRGDFSPRRILLVAPEAKTSTLVFVGPLPPTRQGSEFEDVLLATALGGGDTSVLFDAVRTGLRASYGFGASLDAYARDLRVLVLSGEVETAKLAEAETVVRKAYAEFIEMPEMGDLAARKEPFRANGAETATLPGAASFSGLMALLDGQDPEMALTLPEIVGNVTEVTVMMRAAQAFPKPDGMIVLAVSPDAAALPGACVITSPDQAAGCP